MKYFQIQNYGIDADKRIVLSINIPKLFRT